MPRRPAFSSNELAKMRLTIDDALHRDLGDRPDWIEKRTENIEEWLTPSRGTKNDPWPGASNITPPLIAKNVRGMWARYMATFFATEPFAYVLPVDPQNREDAEAREAWTTFQLRNEIPDFEYEIGMWFMDAILHGSASLMVWWEQKRIFAPEWRVVDQFIDDGFGNGIRKSDRDILEELFEDLRRARPLGSHVYDVDFAEDGFPKNARVTIDRNDPSVREDQVSVTVEQDVIEGRVRVQQTNIEDILVPSSAKGFQCEQAHHLSRIYWKHPDDIARMVESGDYHNLNSEDLTRIETGAASGFSLPQDTQDPERAKDAMQGIDTVDGQSGRHRELVQMVDVYHPWRVGNRDPEVITTYIPSLSKVAGWDYLTTRFGHGRRPFPLLRFLPIPGRTYGMGLGDLLQPFQDEAATLFNQANDRNNLINNPVKLVQSNAGVSPNVFTKLPPGSAVGVRALDRIGTLTWEGIQPIADIPFMNQIFAYADQMSGLGDIQVGVSPNRPNAPRTARGTLALISEGNILLDAHIKIAQLAMREVLHQIDGLNGQFIRPEVKFTITGKEERRITRENFRSRVKFYFTSNTTNTNTQVRQQIAQLLYQAFLPNPLFTGQFVGMPPHSVEALWRLTNLFSKEHLPGRDATEILDPMEEFVQIAAQAQQAQQQGLQERMAREGEMAERELSRKEAETGTDLLKAIGLEGG